MSISKWFRTGVVASGLAIAGMSSAGAVTIDLGFALDASGSIGTSSFNQARAALANALGNIPFGTTDTYRISVVRFDDKASTVITRTISTAADRAAVQAAVAATAYTAGSTCISCGTNLLLSNFQGLSGGLGAFTLFNITTDGEPNDGVTNGTVLRKSLIDAGVDGISAEAVGSFSPSFLLALTGASSVTTNSSLLPNPYASGFVLAVQNFGDYADAIDAKIRNIVVQPPGMATPGPVAGAGLPGLFALGGLLWFRSRRKVADI